MTYRGIVRGNVVRLESKVKLADGTQVRVVVPEKKETSTRGNARALAAALAVPPHCTPADVDALSAAIADGKRPVRFTGPFEREGRDA